MTEPDTADPRGTDPRLRRTWPRALGGRLLLLGLGICLALLVLEGLLRIGAAVLAARSTARPSWVGHSRRILCLGDSNTYGLYVEKSKSYPKVLEALWNPRTGARNVEVLDMGFPVTNSSKLLKDIDRMLLAFRPDVVTVMIGANDFWTVPESAGESPDLRDRVALALWRDSRAYRLLYMMARTLREPRVEVTPTPDHRATVRYGGYEFDLGGRARPKDSPGSWERDLERNLESLPAHVQEIGAQLVFVTYASERGLYGSANTIIRTAARETHTPLVDVAPEFHRLCPKTPCPYFFPDDHPTAAGYERIAQSLMQALMLLSYPSH